jgi:ABC-type iron transport system FetAB ATPase subunit
MISDIREMTLWELYQNASIFSAKPTLFGNFTRENLFFVSKVKKRIRQRKLRLRMLN